MSEPIHIISLGAGVQSSTMALMAAKGEILPMPTAAIFADTKAEPESVYKWLAWLETQLPFPVHRVSKSRGLTHEITTIHTNKKTGEHFYREMIPAFAVGASGKAMIVGRKCTFTFKIEPIIKKIRELADIKRGQKTVGVIQWIGISLDEISRMKPSREPWCEHIWPLVDKGMKRHDCLKWMKANGYATPPRSACFYCPFHSDYDWRRLKDQEPEEFKAAAIIEKRLQWVHRQIQTPGKHNLVPFLHSSMKPLSEVDFSTEEERGQINMFNNECEGMCGV